MFGLSGEHLLVILVVLLVFGPKRLPDLGNSLGRTLKNFKDAMNGKEEVKITAPAAPAVAPQQITQAPEIVKTESIQDAQIADHKV